MRLALIWNFILKAFLEVQGSLFFCVAKLLGRLSNALEAVFGKLEQRDISCDMPSLVNSCSICLIKAHVRGLAYIASVCWLPYLEYTIFMYKNSKRSQEKLSYCNWVANLIALNGYGRLDFEIIYAEIVATCTFDINNTYVETWQKHFMQKPEKHLKHDKCKPRYRYTIRLLFDTKFQRRTFWSKSEIFWQPTCPSTHPES